jgi:hypothetical protein
LTIETMADKLSAMKPQKKIELFSANYFAACTLGGIIACGPTHTMVTPLDLVSLRILSAIGGSLNVKKVEMYGEVRLKQGSS